MVRPGDIVRIRTEDDVLEGTYIEKPSLLGADTIVLKLEHGYNIGIDKHKIKDIKIVKESVKRKVKHEPLPVNKKLPTVLILSTGGTISSKVDYTTGGVLAEYDAHDFVEMCPELSEIANIQAERAIQIMSEDMSTDNWSNIAQVVADRLDNVDGIVITMGTDTFGYTAAALSFALSVNKPVILTAAQRSIDRGSSDAFFNLICAVKAAAEWDGAEVVTCMHGTSADDHCLLLRGTKVRKMHSSRRDAFRPINTSPLASITPKKITPSSMEHKKRGKGKTKLNNLFSSDVGIVYAHPGMKPEVFDTYRKYKGIIIAGTGFGHVPMQVYERVKELIDNGVFVGMTTQSLYGSTSSTVYSPLRRLSLEVGITYLKDMLLETAFAKLSWAAGNKKNIEEIKKTMLDNIAHELNDRQDFNDFLN